MNARFILKELQEITRDPTDGISAGPVGKDIFHWIASIVGPKDTPYEDGVFYLDITFPQDYKFSPPHIVFKTKIYHPNISPEGEICLDILKEKWAPCLIISKVLLSIVSFLDDPNPDCHFNPSVELQYKIDRKAFDQIAREWTLRYAT